MMNLLPATLLQDLMLVQAELVLLVATLGLLMVGVFAGGKWFGRLTALSMATLALCGWLVLQQDFSEVQWAFGELLTTTPFITVMKLLILASSFMALGLALGAAKPEGIARFEYPVLVLLSTLGMLLMISNDNFMALYMGLEMQSLPLYVLVALRRTSANSVEGGLKYFVLGALSSGLFLYGLSLLYGFTGSTDFSILLSVLEGYSAGAVPLGAVVGLVFILAGMVFKVSAVPFHMWTPDVYQGAPTSITAFLAVGPKVAAMALLMRMVFGPLSPLFEQWQQILMLVSVLSMIWGALGAIGQNNIKRLLAYGSIGHIGYALLAVSVGTVQSMQATVFYLTIYVLMTTGTFAGLLAVRRKGEGLEEMKDFAGLAKSHPFTAFMLMIFMFSMAGIPLFAGFWSKYLVFLAAVQAKFYWLAIIGVVTSVIAAYYYLRVVKVMYFDEEKRHFETTRFPVLTTILLTCGILNIALFIYPKPVHEIADFAAKNLFLF